MDFDEILRMQYYYLYMRISRTFQQCYGPGLMLKFQFFSISLDINELILIKFCLCIDY